MIDKDLIELQKGCKATCVVIPNEEYKELDKKITISANVNSYDLLMMFKEDKFESADYFIVTGIDEVDENVQNNFYHIVKDREFHGYELPEDVVIVFTVRDREGLKKITNELYHFCVVAF